MKKTNPRLDIFKEPKYNDINIGKIKRTDINILLNRVKVNKKKEFKQKVIFSSLLLLFVCFLGFFYLFLK